MSLIWPLQTALVSRLKSDAALAARVGGRIYDGQAPQGAVLPYIVVGSTTEAPWDALGRDGSRVTVTCHVWSAYGGRQEAAQIVATMTVALRAPLTLTGYGSAHLRREFAEVLVDSDGVQTLRHAPVRYRVLAMETA